MLSLLLAIAICLLVPWLPILAYRALPRRLPPPPGAGTLHDLAAELAQDGTLEIVAPVVLEEAGGTDSTRRREAPKARPETARHAESNPEQGKGTPAKDPPRLTLGSYRMLNILFIPIFLVTFLALGLGWTLALHFLGEWHAETFPSGVFRFRPFPYGAYFGLQGVFMGILTAIPVLMLAARIVMGKRRFIEYAQWDEGRIETQGKSADGMLQSLSVLALLVGVLGAIAVCLVMNWYACLTEDEILIKSWYWPTREVRAYDTVQEIVVTSHRVVGKELVKAPDLGLRFRDGRTWRTAGAFRMPHDPDEVKELLDFLRRKSGKPIIQARLLDDLPGW